MANRSYWQERMKALENQSYQSALQCYQDIQEEYRKAINNLQMDIMKWYQRLADNNDISYAAAKKFLKTSDLEEFKWTVEQYIKAGEENAIDQRWMKQLKNASCKYHISYLEAMKLQAQQHAELLLSELENGMTEHLHKTYSDQFYRSAYEIAKGTGVGSNLSTLGTDKIELVLQKPWARDGKNFSDRIWNNKEKLINNLHTDLTQSIIRGEDPHNLASHSLYFWPLSPVLPVFFQYILIFLPAQVVSAPPAPHPVRRFLSTLCRSYLPEHSKLPHLRLWQRAGLP